MTSPVSAEPRRRPFSSREVLTVCQIVASFLIVIVALINLSLSDRDKALWSTLVGAGFGYLVPNPTLKQLPRLAEKRQNESVYRVVAEQQLDGLQPAEHGVAIHDETK